MENASQQRTRIAQGFARQKKKKKKKNRPAACHACPFSSHISSRLSPRRYIPRCSTSSDTVVQKAHTRALKFHNAQCALRFRAPEIARLALRLNARLRSRLDFYFSSHFLAKKGYPVLHWPPHLCDIPNKVFLSFSFFFFFFFLSQVDSTLNLSARRSVVVDLSSHFLAIIPRLKKRQI